MFASGSLIAAVAIVLASTGAAPAAEVAWDDGSSSDDNWGTGTNWVGDAVPNSGDTAKFDGSGASPATVGSSQVIDKLLFNNGGPFTIDGSGTLELNGGGIEVQDGNSYTVSAPLQTQTQTWSVATGGSLDLLMAANDSGLQTFTKTGGGSVTVDDDADGKHGIVVDEGTLNVDGVDAGRLATVEVGDEATAATATVLNQGGGLTGDITRRIHKSGTFDNNGNSNALKDDGSGQPGLIMTGGEMMIRSGSKLSTGGNPATIDYQATANGGQATIGGGGELELRGNTGTERIFDIADKSGLDVEMAVDALVTEDSAGNPTLFKRGAGTVAFNADNTHKGPMNVENGTLLVNGATTDGGNYTVGGTGNPATLGGTGTVGLASGNSVTVSADGIVAPGQSIGSLTLGGDTIFGDSSALSIELDSSGQSDVLNVNGALDLSGVGDTLELIDLGGGFDDSDYTIATFDAGTLTGQFDSVTGLDSSYNVVYDDSAGQINLTTTVIPEPASLALLAPAGLLALRRRRA